MLFNPPTIRCRRSTTRVIWPPESSSDRNPSNVPPQTMMDRVRSCRTASCPLATGGGMLQRCLEESESWRSQCTADSLRSKKDIFSPLMRCPLGVVKLINQRVFERRGSDSMLISPQPQQGIPAHEPKAIYIQHPTSCHFLQLPVPSHRDPDPSCCLAEKSLWKLGKHACSALCVQPPAVLCWTPSTSGLGGGGGRRGNSPTPCDITEGWRTFGKTEKSQKSYRPRN